MAGEESFSHKQLAGVKKIGRGSIRFISGMLEKYISHPETGRNDLVSFLVFTTGDRRMAIEVDATDGIVDCPKVTPLPGAPEGIVGVCSIRGRITMVLDLSRGIISSLDRCRLVLFKGDSQLGLVARGLEGVLSVEPGRVYHVEQKRRVKELILREKEKTGETLQYHRYLKNEGRRIPIIDVDSLI